MVLWLVELYLNGLGSLRDFGKNDTAEYRNTEAEFLQFMNQKIVKVLNETDPIIIKLRFQVFKGRFPFL